MGWTCPPLYGNKPSKFYEEKKAKAVAKIKELQAVIEECDKHIADNEKQAPSDKA